MSQGRIVWGIYRETAHSPERVDDDAAIMQRTGAALAERGFAVELLKPDAADAAFAAPGANIFAMCERGEILDRLKEASRAGAVVVNSPDAIRNTYRHRMVELFARYRVPAPFSQIVATDTRDPPLAACMWIKRYDFHATQSDDVMYVASKNGWREALDRFARREIPFVVAQQHVPGDLVKFYGVGRAVGGAPESRWFEWFYHRDKGMTGHAFQATRLREAAFAGAAALGVEVFGGDAIIQPDGAPVIIDLNAWPSFARYRDRAAQVIADLLADRFSRRPRAVT